jgi:hypothetical protein
MLTTPSTLIQMHRMSTQSFTGGAYYALLFSALISFLSVVKAIVGMDFIKDTDVRNRAFFPTFYGIIPLTGSKWVVLAGMGLMTGCQLAMTAFKLVLMKEMIGMGVVFEYMVARQLFWHLVKVGRSDWGYCELGLRPNK